MLAIAALATFVLTAVFSMAGLGAALILIPVFMAFGVEVHSAMATALLLNATGMFITSATFVRKGLVEWRLVVPMLIVAVALSPVGLWAAHGLERDPLLRIILASLVFAAAMVLFYNPKPRAARTSLAGTLALGLPVGGTNIIVLALVAAGLEAQACLGKRLLRGRLRLPERLSHRCPGRPHRRRPARGDGVGHCGCGSLRGLVHDRAASSRSVDLAFTVCAKAASEPCPMWPGHPTTAHWGILDPMSSLWRNGVQAYQDLHQRISAFLAPSLETMSRDEVLAAARRIHAGD